MQPAHIAFRSLTWFSLSALGCAAANSPQADVDSTTSALVSDNDEAVSLEQELEGSLEQPLSGAETEDAAIDTMSDMGAAVAASSNAGLYFRPAGCLTSTRVGNVVTHQFVDCTGPHGRVNLTGTVTSAWSTSASGVVVEHTTQSFQLGDAQLDHTVTLGYGYEDGVYTWVRTASTSGSTARGLSLVHTADYTTRLEPATLCLTRDGAAATSLDGREFSRAIEGYERCGVGVFGCPNAGSFTLDRPRLHLELAFNGGGTYDLMVNGRTFTDRRLLWCIAN